MVCMVEVADKCWLFPWCDVLPSGSLVNIISGMGLTDYVMSWSCAAFRLLFYCTFRRFHIGKASFLSKMLKLMVLKSWIETIRLKHQVLVKCRTIHVYIEIRRFAKLTMLWCSSRIIRNGFSIDCYGLFLSIWLMLEMCRSMDVTSTVTARSMESSGRLYLAIVRIPQMSLECSKALLSKFRCWNLCT